MKALFILLPAIILQIGCGNQFKDKEELKKEILKAEKSFEKMTHEKGIAEAFYYFADTNAVIKRENDSLIYGKEGIKLYYESKDLRNAKVNWTPDFIDVSESGDLAYTYGKYSWMIVDEMGDTNVYRGVFHTVWKRQKDNNWKYVWD